MRQATITAVYAALQPKRIQYSKLVSAAVKGTRPPPTNHPPGTCYCRYADGHETSSSALETARWLAVEMLRQDEAPTSG